MIEGHHVTHEFGSTFFLNCKSADMSCCKPEADMDDACRGKMQVAPTWYAAFASSLNHEKMVMLTEEMCTANGNS